MLPVQSIVVSIEFVYQISITFYSVYIFIELDLFSWGPQSNFFYPF